MCQRVKRLCFNILHILCRCLVIALLGGYLQFFILVFLFLMVGLNFILANLLIKTDRTKHIWTAFAGVLLPKCFISRDSVTKKVLDKVFYNSLYNLKIYLLGSWPVRCSV